MIMIKKYGKTMNVTAAAYKSIYKLSGWTKVSDCTDAEHADSIDEVPIPSDDEVPYDDEVPSDDDSNNEKVEGDDEGDEYTTKRKEELKKIPVGNMSQNELKELAFLLGINIENKSKAQVKSEIAETISLGA